MDQNLNPNSKTNGIDPSSENVQEVFPDTGMGLLKSRIWARTGRAAAILMARHALCVGRVTGTNDPIANLAKSPGCALDYPSVCSVYFVCLFAPNSPPYPLVRGMCVAFITESHFNHRIFDLLPFDISL